MRTNDTRYSLVLTPEQIDWLLKDSVESRGIRGAAIGKVHELLYSAGMPAGRPLGRPRKLESVS